MSGGGYYDYKQHHIRDIADMMEFDVEHNMVMTEGFEGYQFGSDVVARVRELHNLLFKTYQLVKIADSLYSDDMSPDTFCEKYDSIMRGEYEYK